MTSPDYIEKGFKGLDQASIGPVGQWVQELPNYAKRVESRTVGAVTTIYKAWAPFGTAESADGWMIIQTVLDETNGLDLTEGIAGGQAGLFNYSWTGRAGHTYG